MIHIFFIFFFNEIVIIRKSDIVDLHRHPEGEAYK